MSDLHFPFRELVKTIPGFFGIRLEEEPRYEVLESIGEAEIRRYAPALLAEVTLTGTHAAAVDQGFEILARYLFGGNAAQRDLPMTNPVFQRRADEAQAVPVTRDATDRWTISFFLANDARAAEVPAPHDERVRLVEVGERVVAVARYGGNNTEARMDAARAKLLETLRDHRSYRPVAGLAWAQYDAPFVLPFVKRNEVQVEVTTAAQATS